MKLLRLAHEIRKYLARKGLTIKEFAEKAGIHENTMTKVLSGDIGLSYLTLSKIAEAMGKALELKLVNLAPPVIKRQRGEANGESGNSCGAEREHKNQALQNPQRPCKGELRWTGIKSVSFSC